MPSGGARARSGPAPDPNALRRGRADDAEWTRLPAEGRVGEPPAWPLGRTSARERTLWEDLWTRPQAIEWERRRQDYEVALYVRRLVEAEKRLSPVNLSTLVRQMADSLGLTTPGLRANRWVIVDAPVAVVEDAVPVASSRARFRVVTGDADGA